MSEDFVEANQFVCTIEDKEATAIVHKAVDFITLNPFDKADHFIERFIRPL